MLQEQGRMPSNPADRAEILELVYDSEDKFFEAIEETSLESAQRGNNRFVNQLQLQGFSIAFGEYSENVKEKIIQSVRNSNSMLVNRLGKDLENILVTGYGEGIGMQELTDRLTDKFDFEKRVTAETVARTEVVGAQNQAFYENLVESQIEYHMWWTALDSRVRGLNPNDKADHNILQGQIVKVGDRFSNGLLYPGDRSGPIAEWINCRCTEVVYFIPEGKLAPPELSYFYERDLLDRE